MSNSSYGTGNAKTTQPSRIDFELYRLMKGRTHPFRWATRWPGAGASAAMIEARRQGVSPKNGGARMLTPFKLKRCRESGERLYVVSGDEGFGIVTADADAHDPLQTLSDAEHAIRIISEEWTRHIGTYFSGWSYPSSDQGWHLSAWIDYQGFHPRDVCETFHRMQDGLRRFLFQQESSISKSFEVKGHPAYRESDGSLYCGQFTRIPVDLPYWEWMIFPQLKAAKPIPFKLIRHFASSLQQIYAPTPPGPKRVFAPGYGRDLLLWDHEKAAFGNMLEFPSPDTAPTPSAASIPAQPRPQSVPQTPTSGAESQPVPLHTPNEQSAIAPQHPTMNASGQPDAIQPPDCHQTPPTTGPNALNLLDLQSEPNSFIRQRSALMRFARSLGRVPDLQEALSFIYSSGLYTGEWNTNYSRRESRVKDILTHISKTFDPTKARGSAVHTGPHDSLERMRRYAERQYPNGIYYSPKSPGWRSSVISTEHIAVFLYLVEFYLLRDPNADGSAPRARFEKLWKRLWEQSLTTTKWNRHHWLRLREFFVLDGLIVIVDREYGPRKAMRWEITGKFPPFSGLSAEAPENDCEEGSV